MFIKIMVYTITRTISFYDEPINALMWRNFFLHEISIGLIQGFAITISRG